MAGNEQKTPKVLIPKKMQLILLVAGLPLLAWVSYDFAVKMNWIGKPPKAVSHVAENPAPNPAPVPATSTPAPVQPATRDDLPELASIALGPGDPMGELIVGPQAPEPAPTGDTTAPGTTAPPGPPPRIEPLPGPMPSPVPGGLYPSPTTGEPLPGLTPPALPVPVRPSLPAALTTPYPPAHRGHRPDSNVPVALVGTISGSNGSMAVVRQTDVGGSRGSYVRPGEEVGRTGHRVEEIGDGRITLRGSGRRHDLALPADTGHSSASGAAGATQPPRTAPATGIQPADVAPSAEGGARGTLPPNLE